MDTRNLLSKSSWFFGTLFVLLTIAACTTAYNPLEDFDELTPDTTLEAPAPHENNGKNYPEEQVNQGKYLVELMGCGSCHTHGAMIGEPDMNLRMAGSGIGIAYSNPLANPRPGVTYPSNLTPDVKTGLGSWSDQEIITALRHGVNRYGKRLLNVMPWPAFIRLSNEDALAIAAYLRSLPPVDHQVPKNVAKGYKATEPFVYFGVYRSKKD